MAIRYWSPTVVHDDGAPLARVGNIGALEALGVVLIARAKELLEPKKVDNHRRASAVLGTLGDELLAWALDETETAI